MDWITGVILREHPPIYPGDWINRMFAPGWLRWLDLEIAALDAKDDDA